ncbi:hypothetical protein [Streptomyces sp. V3I8]|uniref:hypothetical protein n=1 Tax=Streptomyces sp. V3I8 TaxID=3042279 RepID=UPI0027D91B18|nr:hypothetical protein [Streptomyces sp. V3I8]
MNSGTIGGKDVVAFYWNANYNSQSYGCLAPGEKYADSLADNTYSGGSYSMDDSIASHAWVTASACAPGTWIA